MTRRDAATLGAAVAGHVLLFAMLSLTWRAAPKPPPAESMPVEVSLADAVDLSAHTPPASVPPSQSTAPEAGPPDDAPPPAGAAPAEPDRALPKPDAVPSPRPAPKPLPAEHKPVAEKPNKPDRSKAPSEASPAKAKPVALAKAAGADAKATKSRATGSLLDDDFRRGLTQSPSPARASEAAPGATMDAKAAADIGSAIQRQVQPCANRQVIPGPGASRIVITVRLNLNRDGSLGRPPEIAAPPTGVDDDNERYVDAVKRSAIATYTGCSPLRGLPQELYDVPRGWKRFSLRYHLPG